MTEEKSVPKTEKANINQARDLLPMDVTALPAPGAGGYPRQIVENAFSLYAQYVPMDHICRQMKISKDTIFNWKRKWNWEERRQKINQLAERNTDENLAKVRARQLSTVRASITRYLELLKTGSIEISPTDLVALMKHELHLLGQAETSASVRGGITIETVQKVYREMIVEMRKKTETKQPPKISI